MEQPQTKELPITNCHTHTFTGDHVPPWLAKSFLPVFYKLLNVQWLVAIFRFWYLDKRSPYRWPYTRKGKLFNRANYKSRVWISRHLAINALYTIAAVISTILIIYYCIKWLSTWTSPGEAITKYLNELNTYINEHPSLHFLHTAWFITLIFLLFIILFPSWRRLVFFILKKIFSILNVLPGKHTRDLVSRYMTIGRFAFKRNQWAIFADLAEQYPLGTRFIVLPMDMDYMDAGAAKADYLSQMNDLVKMKRKKLYKDILFPFVFADPRRMAEDQGYFNYTVQNGKVVLGNCYMKYYLETEKFSGIKIYPALGYYPFDEQLLPLWKYVADNGIPILTHCISGVIFYRGKKIKEWDQHPVFKQAMGRGEYEPMLLPQRKNIDYSLNFTHPLNYLCLLNKAYLRKIVAASTDTKLHSVFGYDAASGNMQHDLGHLKLCFGHFGGEDQWKRYMQIDRDNYANMLNRYPDRGIEFLMDANRKLSEGKPEQLWNRLDWYSIICSLMLQYPGVYADISYILHDLEIFPLLKQTLSHQKLQTRVLYGTDFYVVRNHKSDKNLWAETMSGLSEEEFNQIARINPETYLFSKPVYCPHPNDFVNAIIT